MSISVIETERSIFIGTLGVRTKSYQESGHIGFHSNLHGCHFSIIASIIHLQVWAFYVILQSFVGVCDDQNLYGGILTYHIVNDA